MRSIIFTTLVSALLLTGAAQAGGYGTDTYRVERPSISRHVYQHYDNDDYCPTPSSYRPYGSHYRPYGHHHRPYGSHYRPYGHHHRPSYYNRDDD